MEPLLANHAWWHTHGEVIVWFAAVLAAIGVIIKTPVGRVFGWVWRHLVSTPVTEWGTRVVGDVVESKVAGANGGSSLRDRVDSLGEGQENLARLAETAESDRADIKMALANIHKCLDTRFADTHDRMEKLADYAEAVLSESIGAKERIRQMYRSLNVPVFESDANGWCTYINPAFSKMTGLTPQEARGEGWAQALHPEDRTRVFESWAQAVENRTELVLLFRIINVLSGVEREIRVSATPLHDAHHQVVGWVGTMDEVDRSAILDAEPS